MEYSCEWRCECGKLLFKGHGQASIEVKCPRCKKINFINLECQRAPKNAKSITK